MGETISFRATPIIQKYIDSENRKQPDKKRSKIIVELLEKTLSYSGRKATPPSLLHVERGKNIDEVQLIRRHDKLLIPCLNTNRWVDPKQDCTGCKVKCSLTKDLRLLIEGLMVNTRS